MHNRISDQEVKSVCFSLKSELVAATTQHEFTLAEEHSSSMLERVGAVI